MNIFLTIVFIIASLIALLIISVVLRYDIQQNRNYKNAEICPGTIVESIGTVYKDTYGSGLVHKQRRKYEKYSVRYAYRGEWRQDEVLTVRRGLNAGDALEVHVYRAEDGSDAIASDIHGRRLRELLIALVVAVIFSAVYILIEKNK